jgi:hypothetical protein
MKKNNIHLLISFFAISFSAYSQQSSLTVVGPSILDNQGSRTLLINGDNADSWLTFHDFNDDWFSVGMDYSDGRKFKINRGGNLGDYNHFTLTLDGKVGIATNIPSYTLDVSGSWALRQNGYFYNSVAFAYESATNRYLRFKVQGGKGYVGMENSSDLVLQSAGGNVGIGTTAPDAKLTVKGGIIHAEEVKLDLNVPGPDYVFEESYPILSLEDTKAYVEQNKHLPGIPSSDDMQQNGVNLLEMNMKLLEKVEELTLHLIEQNERLEKI